MTILTACSHSSSGYFRCAGMTLRPSRDQSLQDPRGGPGSCLAAQDDASGGPQGGVYARVGDVVAVINAVPLRGTASGAPRAGLWS